MLCDNIVNAVCSRFLEEACDLTQNIRVGLSIGIIKAWGVNECKYPAIGCSPAMDTDFRRLGLDSVPDLGPWVLSDELDELFLVSAPLYGYKQVQIA
jgi:hypothetical protein